MTRLRTDLASQGRTAGDTTSGDGVFAATLPPTVQVHRRLVRYRITAADNRNQSVQTPYADDASPNFAYFCYNGIPSWAGAFRPGAAGQPGVERAIALLKDEIERGMRLMGVASVGELGRDRLRWR